MISWAATSTWRMNVLQGVSLKELTDLNRLYHIPTGTLFTSSTNTTSFSCHSSSSFFSVSSPFGAGRFCRSTNREAVTRAKNIHHTTKLGGQMIQGCITPGPRSPWRLDFVLWHPTCEGPQCVACFMSPFCHLTGKLSQHSLSYAYHKIPLHLPTEERIIKLTCVILKLTAKANI